MIAFPYHYTLKHPIQLTHDGKPTRAVEELTFDLITFGDVERIFPSAAAVNNATYAQTRRVVEVSTGHPAVVINKLKGQDWAHAQAAVAEILRLTLGPTADTAGGDDG